MYTMLPVLSTETPSSYISPLPPHRSIQIPESLSDSSQISKDGHLKTRSDTFSGILDFKYQHFKESRSLSDSPSVIKHLRARRRKYNAYINDKMFMIAATYVKRNNREVQEEIGLYVNKTTIQVEQHKFIQDNRLRTQQLIKRDIDMKIVPRVDMPMAIQAITYETTANQPANNNKLCLECDKIDGFCNCHKKSIHKNKMILNRLFNQNIFGVKDFWRGTSLIYPFTYKKQACICFSDTNELSLYDICDYSRKTIKND